MLLGRRLVELLPSDWRAGRFVGRIESDAGPSPILVQAGVAYDMVRVAPTVAQLVAGSPVAPETGIALGPLDALPYRLLSPIDLQCVKAAGVTFANSTLERVIEEQARGDADAAAEIRQRIETRIGGSILSLTPGSPEADDVKTLLIEEGLWSQYLEVAIGPHAEVFTKAPVLSTVGVGMDIGIRSDSTWNNPEPEIALVVDADGKIVGATLGNDVNLRDFEGRSALLLGKAKDNNASCSLGPLIRLFDESFSLDDVRRAEVRLTIDGPDGYRLEGLSSMSQISRDPVDLVRQTMSEHQYPDGFVLFLGTLFAPVQDRDEPGRGFTHKVGDLVSISTPRLGCLVNRVVTSKDADPWTGGIGSFISNLASRGLLAPERESRTAGPGFKRAVYPSLAGKRVLVSGGASGIGEGLVRAFAAQHAQVVFCDIAREAGDRLEARLTVDAATKPIFIPCDLRDLSAVQTMMTEIENLLGGVDVVINNAARDDRHSVADITPAYWDDSIAVNLRHQFFVAQAAVPAMKRAGGGAIINIGSISWHLGLPGMVVYQTAKAAIEGMTRGLARELGRDNIRVTAIIPGNVKTPRQDGWYTPEAEAEIVEAQCLNGRLMPEDVAALALFLASDDARLMTGHNYWVDAGWA